MSRLIAGVASLVIACSSPALAQLQTSVDVGAGVTAGRGTGMGAAAQAALELQPGRYRRFGEVRTHFVDSHDRQRLTPFVVGLRF